MWFENHIPIRTRFQFKLRLTFPFLSTADTSSTFCGEFDRPLGWDLSIGLPRPAADKLIWEWECWLGKLNLGLDLLLDINEPAKDVWQLEQALVHAHELGETLLATCRWWPVDRSWPEWCWCEQQESLLWYPDPPEFFLDNAQECSSSDPWWQWVWWWISHILQELAPELVADDPLFKITPASE